MLYDYGDTTTDSGLPQERFESPRDASDTNALQPSEDKEQAEVEGRIAANSLPITAVVEDGDAFDVTATEKAKQPAFTPPLKGAVPLIVEIPKGTPTQTEQSAQEPDPELTPLADKEVARRFLPKRHAGKSPQENQEPAEIQEDSAETPPPASGAGEGGDGGKEPPPPLSGSGEEEEPGEKAGKEKLVLKQQGVSEAATQSRLGLEFQKSRSAKDEAIITGLKAKGASFAQAAAYSRDTRENLARVTKLYVELKPITKVVTNTQGIEERPGRTAASVEAYVSAEKPEPRELVKMVDTFADQLLRGVATQDFDIVDVIIGSHAFEQASKAIFATVASNHPEEEAEIETVRQALVDQITFRLMDQVPFEQTVRLFPWEIEEVAKASLGSDAEFSERTIGRISRSMFDHVIVTNLAAFNEHMESKEASRRLPSLTRQLTAGLAARQEEGGQMPTLVVKGSDIGFPAGVDIIMGHPDVYGEPRPENEKVIADFYIVESREIHQLPIMEWDEAGFRVIFGEEEKATMPLRLFADGKVDYGWPLLGAPHRPIDPIFRALNAQGALDYTVCILAALATDATAPPEVIEIGGGQSVPRIISDATAEGRSGGELLDIMATTVIPQRIAIVHNREHSEDSAGTGTPKRWHTAKAHARILREGYRRSQDNLNKYLRDLETKRIQPLRPEDDMAIREGRKSYVPPSERGDKSRGSVVSRRARLGEGATRQITDLGLPGSGDSDQSSSE
ncbi:MAG TPA: hypothetical protein VLF60_02805 [Candidatus Saccharimonadales bacterium]|nr:hypothetical protein [Candidatus Saccharimonadales bacterium]